LRLETASKQLSGTLRAFRAQTAPNEEHGYVRHRFIADPAQRCDDLGSSGVDNIYGYGRIDIGNSLAMVNVCDATSYCTSGPNSSGQSSTINFSGTTSVAANDFGVFSSGNPSNQNGIFYMGVNQTNFAFGNGRQCVSGQITRYPLVQSDTFGIAFYQVDNTAAPAVGKIIPNSTWNWQFWFRDPMGGGSSFDTSNGLSVLYCP
jgi:hypothetical protein